MKKVYCKDCKYRKYTKYDLHASCGLSNTKDQKKVYDKCYTRNKDNNCLDFKRSNI